jgi:hypothetical protein
VPQSADNVSPFRLKCVGSDATRHSSHRLTRLLDFDLAGMLWTRYVNCIDDQTGSFWTCSARDEVFARNSFGPNCMIHVSSQPTATTAWKSANSVPGVSFRIDTSARSDLSDPVPNIPSSAAEVLSPASLPKVIVPHVRRGLLQIFEPQGH